MNIQIAAFSACVLCCLSEGARARDLGEEETSRLQEAGTILPYARLDGIIRGMHPQATLEDIEMDENYGHYIYQVELRDAQGVEWEVELDATDGQVLKNYQDR